MNAYKQILQDLDASPVIEPSRSRWWKVQSLIGLANATRRYMDIVGDRFSTDVQTYCQRGQQQSLRALGSKRFAAGTHYLTPAEVADFESRGIHGPFPLLSACEATRLRRFLVEGHQTDFNGQLFFNDNIVRRFKAAQRWSLNESGMYQGLVQQPLWDALTHPRLAHRLASLLGDNVYCWRSQVFERAAGSNGTFWHQNAFFQETNRARKLFASQDVDTPMVQLTAWIALEDVTKKNAALRIVPGSFRDTTIERYFEYANRRSIRALASVFDRMNAKEREQAVYKSIYGGSFESAQVGIRIALEELAHLEGFLSQLPVVDVEMKAGECILFTSANLHASHSNSSDDDRIALVGRYIGDRVKVFGDATDFKKRTPGGSIAQSLAQAHCMLVHGKVIGTNPTMTSCTPGHFYAQ